MTDKEIDRIIDEALKLYMKEESKKAEKELKKLEKEEIEFSKEHKRKMKKIFTEYRKK